MPRLKPLLKLEEIVKEKLQLWFLKSVSNNPGPTNRLIQKKYVNQLLTGNMGQQLLSRSLKYPKTALDLGEKCLILELLCNQLTLCIDLTSGGSLLIDELFKLYRTLLPCIPVGVVRLGIICDIKPGIDQRYIKDVNSFFYRILGTMKNLRWVTLAGVGDTEILRQLGLHCESLEYLDVSDSWLINDRSVACLLLECPNLCKEKKVHDLISLQEDRNSCSDHLKFIGLKGTEITNKSIALCFTNCPKMISLGGYIYKGSVLHILQLLQPKEGHREFNIKQLWEDKILESQAIILSKICPRLDVLFTSSYSLSSICDLHSLTSLTLDCDYQDWSEELYCYLGSHGSTLKRLVLNEYVNCKLDIGWLMEMTPSLVFLTAYLYYSDIGYPTPWNSLQIANIMVDSSKCMYELLTHAPEITDLDLKFKADPYCELDICVNDDLIIDIASNGGLLNAKHIKISDCDLGIVALETLLLYCTEIESISTLSLWKNFNKAHYDQLQEQSKLLNWNLKLNFYEQYT